MQPLPRGYGGQRFGADLVDLRAAVLDVPLDDDPPDVLAVADEVDDAYNVPLLLLVKEGKEWRDGENIPGVVQQEECQDEDRARRPRTRPSAARTATCNR